MEPLDWLTNELKRLKPATDQAIEWPETAPRRALAYFDAESSLAELEALLLLWQQIWQGEEISLILALNHPHGWIEALENLMPELWPADQPQPDLVILEAVQPESLPLFLAACDLYVSAALVDSVALLQAALAGCAILCPDSWFHRFLQDQPGVWLYDLASASEMTLAPLLAGCPYTRSLSLPENIQPASLSPVFDWIPTLQKAEAAFCSGDANQAQQLCLELLQKQGAHLPAALVNPELLAPDELAAFQLLQLRLQRYLVPENATAKP